MTITAISSGLNPLYPSSSTEKTEKNATGNSPQQRAGGDTVTLSASSQREAITYSSALKLLGVDNSEYSQLHQQVLRILHEQGVELQIKAGEQEIDLASLTQQEAAELVGEDGYFGIEQTSDRMVDLAIAIAGGDVSKLDVIKEGMAQGFQEALEAFGGWLPDISHATYDRALEKLDDWAASGSQPS